MLLQLSDSIQFNSLAEYGQEHGGLASPEQPSIYSIQRCVYERLAIRNYTLLAYDVDKK